MSSSEEAWQQMCADLKDYERIKKQIKVLTDKYAEVNKHIDVVDVEIVVDDLVALGGNNG